ncbi:MAG: SMC-Scp complex subunit ScpB [Halioglobus sp.]
MSEIGLVQIIEGALLAAGKAMSVAQLAELFEEQERPQTTEIREALKEVADRCEDRGFELQEVASGFRFQVRQALSPWVARLWQERPQKYSRALLETLSLIAYRQPITRGEIEEIRGVAVSSNIVKTLHEREWIRVVGHRDVPGRPAMYATTRAFLDYFNLKNLDQLPALAEIRDLETLNAELGFSEPLQPEVDATADDAPELTVVGGTEHTPQHDEIASEEVAGSVDADAATLDVTNDAERQAGSGDESEPDVEVEDLQSVASDILADAETDTGDAVESADDADSAAGAETEPRS